MSSTVALTDASGTVLERYNYDAYGKPHYMTSAYAPLTASSYGTKVLFTGKELDTLDGGSLTLQYNLNRYYSNSLGRWLTPDPLGIVPNARMGNERFAVATQYKDGLSYYEYVKSCTVQKVDPIGTDSIGDLGSAFGFGGYNYNDFVYPNYVYRYPGPFGPVCGPEGSWEATWLVPDKPLWLADFTKPCQLHDYCYGCDPEEKYKHRPKSYCDKLFLTAMELECDKNFPGVSVLPLKIRCYAVAQIYYQFVHSEIFGGPAFDDARRNTCCTKMH